MTVDSLSETFAYHLEEMYYVENRLVEVLDRMASEVSNGDLAAGLEEHREQTRRHVERLERVFEAIDEPPAERESPTFEALLEERARFFERAGDEDVRDLHDLGAAAKTEHLEIANYETLLMLARKLDLDRDVRELLEENLEEEQRTKKRLKAMADDSAVRKLFARLAG